MNKKYERYINYIIEDIQPPYFINMRDNYGLRSGEYKLILDKVFDQPLNIIYHHPKYSVYDINGNQIYFEDSSNGYWFKKEYDTNGNLIYIENSNGLWYKREYDSNGNLIYYEDSNGRIIDNR